MRSALHHVLRRLPRVAGLLLAGVCALSLLSIASHALAATPVPEARLSALDAAGPQASNFIELWRIFLWSCGVVFVLILAALLWVVWTRPGADGAVPPDLSVVDRPEPRVRRRVAIAVAASVVGLLLLIAGSVLTDRRADRLPLQGAVNIQLTGNQWWWSARYRSGSPADEFTTANELHIPVGRPVLLELRSNDVIHSFWVPSLSGKLDLIPGRTALLQLRADQPGVYRGQCAEFCGYQHALMALLVVAQPESEFDAWLAAQRAPAAPPADPRARRGKTVFEAAACAMCHGVQGSIAGARNAPDLTHVGSRRTLAALAIPNDRDNLRRWIQDPQRIKPGTNMPSVALSDDDLDAVVTYLEQLK